MTTPKDDQAIEVIDATTRELVRAAPGGVPTGLAQLTSRQVDVVRNALLPEANDDELELFIVVAQRSGLDPFRREIWGWMQWDAQNQKQRLITQTSIDGFRRIAQDTGEFEGMEGPWWCGPDGEWVAVWLKDEPPAAAKVIIHRTGKLVRESVALYRESVQRGRGGGPNAMWERRPAAQLAKCFDEETEVLTDQGFQRFAEVTGRVLQVTERGLEPTDATPFVQPYHGLMVVFESDDLNFAVTPNHDLLLDDWTKIEAGALYAQSGARPRFRLPRLVRGSQPGRGLDRRQLALAGAFVADGYEGQYGGIVSVSRPHKIAMLRGLRLHHAESGERAAGHRALARSGRVLTTTRDKVKFTYAFDLLRPLVGPGKVIDPAVLLTLSRAEARRFVDAWIAFDGSVDRRSGVQRLFTSRLDHLQAFELAATIAGYTVSPRRARTSDLSDRPNYHVTVSDRDAIAVSRWGRSTAASRSVNRGRFHRSLELRPNPSGRVWCVTVPSHLIVVRRHGFAMVTGNCAEMLGLRQEFPDRLVGIYGDAELDRGDSGRGERAAQLPAPDQGRGGRPGGSAAPAARPAASRAPSAPTAPRPPQAREPDEPSRVPADPAEIPAIDSNGDLLTWARDRFHWTRDQLLDFVRRAGVPIKDITELRGLVVGQYFDGDYRRLAAVVAEHHETGEYPTFARPPAEPDGESGQPPLGGQ